jgi:hypothetical protein
MIILATGIFFCVAAKSDALRCLQEVYHEIFRDTWNHLQIFRTDGGGEFTSKRFEEYLSQQGVRHEITAPYCPEQNGFCGRDNRTIMEGVRSLLHTSGFPPTFWAEACHTVVYTLNRTGSRMIPGNTPFTLWHGFKPSLKHLRIFGCHAYAYVEKHQRTKLDPKSHLCYFLGYCDNTKGYRLWDPATSQVLLRRDVIFNEQLLYGSSVEPSFSTSSDPPSHVSFSLHDPSFSSTNNLSSFDSHSEPSEATLSPVSQLPGSPILSPPIDSPVCAATAPASFSPLTPSTLINHPNYQPSTPVRLRSLADIELPAPSSSNSASLSPAHAHLSHTLPNSSSQRSLSSPDSAVLSSPITEPITADFSPDDPFTYLDALHSPEAAQWALP